MRITVVILICLICSCRNEGSNEKAPVKVTDASWSNEHSVDFNQEVHNREEIDIKIYLEHHKELKMTETNTGLRYQIIQKGSEEQPLAKEGDFVSVHLKIGLLSGRVCYETDSIPDEFILGKSDRESGLQEALKMMRVDDFARLIMPSYMAHGLLGNSENIPPQSVLVVDVELLNLQR